MLKKIDHIGIAVDSIALTGAVLERLGLTKQGEEEIPSQKLRVAHYEIGDVSIELLEPLSPEATVAKFLQSRGQGIHHIAYETDDVRAEQRRLVDQGFEFIDKIPRSGAHRTRIAFLHPKDTARVLTELVEHLQE